MGSVGEEVKQREFDEATKLTIWQQERMRLPGILLGAAVFAAGTNLFLRPLHLYSGGIMGFSQLIVTVAQKYFGITLRGVDLAGIIYYVLNLPGLILAYKYMRRRFVFKTIASVTVITIFLTIIPIPSAPILDETLGNCLVAGIMAGAGVGIILRTGASDGGVTLLGMTAIQHGAHLSVGKVNILVNIVLYGICLLLFDIPTVIYSLIYTVINSMTCDKVHAQNINVEVLIITKLEDTGPMEVEIMGSLYRGLTRMNATGRFTGENESVFLTVINKYELSKLLAVVQEYDENAFIVVNEGISVEGNFQKKLT